MNKLATWLLPLLLVVFFAWAYTFEIISEIKTIGYVVTGKKKQIVTHKEGGVIEKVFVKEGDTVNTNDSLMIIGNLHISERRKKLEESVDQLKARLHRLESEISKQPFFYSGGYSEKKFILENKILDAYLDSHKKKIKVLEEKTITQVLLMKHLISEKKLLSEEVALLDEKQAVAKELFNKGAGSESIYINAQIESVRAKNRLNNILEKLDLTNSQKSELLSEIAYEESAYLRNRYEKLDETRLELNQNLVELSTIQARANRQEILSPMLGTVHEVMVDTIGSAVRPNQELLAIIPNDNSYVVEARLNLEDRDLVWPGMDVRVTPPKNTIYMLSPIVSEVAQISADSFFDNNSQHTYFKVFILISSDDDYEHSLYQGMQVDVRLDTGSHSVFEYLTRPFMRGMKDVMREPLL